MRGDGALVPADSGIADENWADGGLNPEVIETIQKTQGKNLVNGPRAVRGRRRIGRRSVERDLCLPVGSGTGTSSGRLARPDCPRCSDLPARRESAPTSRGAAEST